MPSLLDFSLQYPRSSWFIVIGNFEDVSGVDVVVESTAHDMIALYVEFEDGDLWKLHISERVTHFAFEGGRHTLLYVAEYIALERSTVAMLFEKFLVHAALSRGHIICRYQRLNSDLGEGLLGRLDFGT